METTPDNTPLRTVLIVDDNASAVAAIEALLIPLGHRTVIARNGEEALALVKSERPDMMLLDVMMPGMSGFEVCEIIRQDANTRDLPVVMITALQDRDSRVKGLSVGADDFLSKPVDGLELRTRVTATLKADRYRRQLAQRKMHLSTMRGSVALMRDILSMVDPDVFGHAQRLERLAKQMGEAVGYKPIWELEVAALLCQVGRVTLPEDIRALSLQTQKLKSHEMQQVKRVPEIGAALLKHIPGFNRISDIVGWQDKRFDGTGLPATPVSGGQIPLGSRIIRLIRDLLVLEDGGLSRRAALEECKNRPGHYDPELVEIAHELFTGDDSVEKLVTMRDLSVGMITRSSIVDTAGRVMVAPGQEITSMMLASLANFHSRVGLVEPFEVRVAATAATA